MTRTRDIFDNADTVEAVIYTTVGAGSTCWESLSGTGVFQEYEAREIAEAALDRIRELLSEPDGTLVQDVAGALVQDIGRVTNRPTQMSGHHE